MFYLHCIYCFTDAGKTVYSGLTMDVEGHVLYFSDEGQGQIGEFNVTADDVTTARIIDSETQSKPRAIAVDTVNR